MTYQDYINLHFTRWDVNDSVEISQTGYGGFHLERKINDRIPISCEVVKSIFASK